jgi:hypothetical protein
MAVDAVVDDQGCDVVCDTGNPVSPEGECVALDGECTWQ